jgi:hypothetical protein
MAEDDEEEAEPAVELGERAPVEGAPLARVTSRLSWPIKLSTIQRREGDTVVRTTRGPKDLSTLLEGVDTTYFESRDEFVSALRPIVGTGPVQAE